MSRLIRFKRTHVNVENVYPLRVADRMDNSADSITSAVKALRARSGLAMAAVAKAMGYKNASSFQRYEDPSEYPGGYLKRDLVEKLAAAFVGKGQPPITAAEVWKLAGPEYAPVKPYSGFDPDVPDVAEQIEQMTIGEHTGARGIPDGSTPQLDVTAGMGAGGFVLTSEGVPGKFGMTFAADHISGFWQLPDQVLSGLSLRARDTVVIPVQGNSMAPTLIEGDYVFIDTRHRWPSPDGVYALADDFGGIVVKTLRISEQRGDDGPYIDVVSDNPDRDRYPVKTRPAGEIRIIGRVVRRFSAVF